MPISPTRVVASILTVLALAASLVVAPAHVAQAADAKDFDPGYLISDEDFFNGSSLTGAEADAFIKGMNKGCASGKTCIRNYKEDITAKSATTRCKAISAAKNQTAGQIIAKVGKACGISPKAILVILQKEQSLVTSTAPAERAFWYAMGAGCPDSTGCTTPYKGLYAQVYYGASLLKGYTLTSSSHYNRYAAGKTSNIQYHPNTSCGTKSVFVKNQATHALYVYTPYTPNAAALKNLTGKGDSCSSYGNRNFWRLYTDWWGATGSAGAIAIDAMYTKLGGSTGSLGARVGSIVKSTAKKGGVYQEYKKGIIAWNQKHGAHVITGEIAKSWKARIADFGWPKADPKTSSADGGGTYQDFDSALLTQQGSGKVYTVWSAIRTLYLDNKGPDGPMGWPAGYHAKDANARYTQLFTSGTAYREDTKAGFVPTELVDEYTKRGGIAGALGWPKSVTATATTERGGGLWQEFDSGNIYSSSHGTFPVYNVTLKKFLERGGIAKVGWPIGSRAYYGDTAWRQQDFENGSILVNGSQAAYLATELVPTWASSGFSSGSIGDPTSNHKTIATNGGGVYQGFVKAAVAKQPSKKAFLLTGKFRTAWGDTGHVDGTLGWPTSSLTPKPDLKIDVQKFERGVVIADASKYAIVGINQWELSKAEGLGGGALGWPKGNVGWSSARDGGEYQTFANGTITWQESRGAFFIPKPVWEARNQAGGLAGTGWPTGVVKTSGAGAGGKYQYFEDGAITWQESRGAFFIPQPMWEARNQAGGLAGTGWPTAAVGTSSAGTGGKYQNFEKGAMAWNDKRGAFFVPKAIWDARKKVGGLAGLGWPTAPATTDSKGKLSQKFEKGTVAVTETAGAVVTLK